MFRALSDLPLESLLNQSGALVALFDDTDTLRFANPEFCRTYHVSADAAISWRELMRRNFSERRGAAIMTDDFDAWLASAASRRGKLPYRAFEADLMDGRWIWMSETLRADGWMLCLALDITDLKKDSRELRISRDEALRAANTDYLTGISNRAHIMHLLGQALSSQRSGQQEEIHLALFDLDYFKQINDHYGHLTGDRILVHFAHSLQTSIRREDSCGRYGGEEFLLLLRGINAAQSVQIIERLLARIRSAVPISDLPQLHYSASAALVKLQASESLTQVLNRVDIGLYEAKRSGRDRLIDLSRN